MSKVSVEQVDVQLELLEDVRNALPNGDPYRDVIEDHRLELHAHHHPVAFVAKLDDKPLGYALLEQLAHKPEAILDIVVAPVPEEHELVEALLEEVIEDTIVRISWWTRAPRFLNTDELAGKYGGEPHRTVLRYLRTIDQPIENPLETRAFVDADAPEIIRINNEAFRGHHDRAELTENDLHEKLRVFGNRSEDLRVIEGGFCWIKRRTPNESEIFVLALDETHQGHGAGERLLDAALDYIRTEHRVKYVSLYVEHDNARAIKLYERKGFFDTDETLHSVVIPPR